MGLRGIDVTVSAAPPFNNHTGNGVTTAFAYGFRILDATHLKVYLDGVLQSAGYSVGGVGAAGGGTVTFTTAPGSGVAVLLKRSVPRTRTVDYVDNGDFTAADIDNDQDLQTMQFQDLGADVDRALKFPVGEAPEDLPAAASRLGKYLGFNASTGLWELLDGSGTATDAAMVTYTPSGSGAVARTVQGRLRDTVSVLDFIPVALHAGIAARTNTTDLTAYIQAAVNAHRGTVFFPAGLYAISSAVILYPETLIEGEGAGAYFAGSGYNRLTVIQPTAAFASSDVFRADPADQSSGLSYTYGVAVRDLLVDCINIKNQTKTIFKLLSLSNSESWSNVRIINNNSNVGIYIGKSANASALVSDGLVFDNVYTLQCDSGGSSTNPVVSIAAANEVSFRDCKFQRGSDPATAAGSAAVLVSAAAGQAINAITFSTCSFAGAEVGLRVQGNAADGQGPRWIRCHDGTFEGPKYPIYISGTSARPAQFCVVGPGNRFISLAAGGTAVVFDAYASNCLAYLDEFAAILLNSNSQSNIVYAPASYTDSGTNNAIISRNGNAVRVNNLYREATVAPTLLNSWVNDSPSNRTTAGYWKDPTGVVHLQGYLSGGTFSAGAPVPVFTLPAGHRPVNGSSFAVATGGGAGVVLVSQGGDVLPLVGSGYLALDGITFPIS